MKKFKVLTNIAGSYVTIFKNKEYYIDARKDVRYPEVSFIEIVKYGQVLLQDCVLNKKAPEVIIKYMANINELSVPHQTTISI